MKCTSGPDMGWRRENLEAGGRCCDYRGKTWNSGLGDGGKRRGKLGRRESLRLRVPL